MKRLIVSALIAAGVAAGVASCAHLQGSTPRGCLELNPPSEVYCHSGGMMLFAPVTVSMMCEADSPRRWILTSEDGRGAVTAIGADCFTVIRGVH